jgi:hypothetical protein
MLLIQIVAMTIYVMKCLSEQNSQTISYAQIVSQPPGSYIHFNAKECLILAWSILDEPPVRARSPEKERAPCEQTLREPFAIEKGPPS